MYRSEKSSIHTPSVAMVIGMPYAIKRLRMVKSILSLMAKLPAAAIRQMNGSVRTRRARFPSRIASMSNLNSMISTRVIRKEKTLDTRTNKEWVLILRCILRTFFSVLLMREKANMTVPIWKSSLSCGVMSMNASTTRITAVTDTPRRMLVFISVVSIDDSALFLSYSL